MTRVLLVVLCAVCWLLALVLLVMALRDRRK